MHTNETRVYLQKQTSLHAELCTFASRLNTFIQVAITVFAGAKRLHVAMQCKHEYTHKQTVRSQWQQVCVL